MFFHRVCLYIIHFIALVYAYCKFFLGEIQQRFFGRKISKSEISQCKKFPNHMAIVLDEYTPKHAQSLVKAVGFILDNTQIPYISLFFTEKPRNIPSFPDRVKVYEKEDVPESFKEAMETKKPLSEISTPFPVPLDLVVIYSKIPSLCDFFPWNLDLAILHFAGQIENLSELSLTEALIEFSSSEQRHGK